MHTASIQDGLLAALTERFEADPSHFVSLPKQIVDSSSARAVIAELRNDGYVEEKERGVIRLTIRGYKVHRARSHYNWAEASVLVAV